jgi:catechol 2,3-dioxygenase-like lactoylglutathione lyase family enzyme
MPSVAAVGCRSIAFNRLGETVFFFEALLHILGYELGGEVEDATGRRRRIAVRPGAKALTITEAEPEPTQLPTLAPCARHLVFGADTRERVDEVCVFAEWLGASILDGPRDDGDSGYLVRFRGSDRLTLEVAHRPGASLAG